MNQLSDRERELVAIGAAMGSNCPTCIGHHVPLALAAGLTVAEIEEAVGLADAVRSVSAGNTLTAALAALDGDSAGDDARRQGSACDQLGRPSRACC